MKNFRETKTKKCILVRRGEELERESEISDDYCEVEEKERTI